VTVSSLTGSWAHFSNACCTEPRLSDHLTQLSKISPNSEIGAASSYSFISPEKATSPATTIRSMPSAAFWHMSSHSASSSAACTFGSGDCTLIFFSIIHPSCV
jgi:hypothetical protein